MARTRRGLGKGLEALIPPTVTAVVPGVREVDVERILPNPRQPRQAMPPESLTELADSIKQHGVIQPLIVTELPPEEGYEPSAVTYQIIAGERRWEAAKLAGLRRVPVMVREAAPEETLQLALVENLQRADLNPLEAATAYQQLREEFGLTQQEIADAVGVSRETVANALRLLRLPDEIKVHLLGERISEGHARPLLRLGSLEDQLAVVQAIIKRGLSVRQTEDLVRRMVEGGEVEVRERPKRDPQVLALEDKFREALGTKVSLSRTKKGGGRLVIHFYSEEELQAIYQVIVGE
ncbi:MAG: ParB/RepB/Spo0J family partition protein [Anaerolineae bacterium]